MKKVKILALIALLVLTSIVSIKISNAIRKPVPPDIRVDTLYRYKFKPIEPYKLVEVPKFVLFFHTDTVAIKEIVHDLSHITVTLGNNQAYTYSTQFLAQYPNANKLVQFTVKSNELRLTQFNSKGQLLTDVFDFRPEFYNYVYSNGTLTKKQKGFFQKFGLSADLMYRPISNLYDFNLGVSHKTSIFIYEVGINAHYYPAVQKQVGFDPYLRIRAQI